MPKASPGKAQRATPAWDVAGVANPSISSVTSLIPKGRKDCGGREMKSKKSKLVTSGAASPIPTGRKDCGGRRDRQTPVNRWQGCSPTPMGRKDHGGNDPMEGSELS